MDNILLPSPQITPTSLNITSNIATSKLLSPLNQPIPPSVINPKKRKACKPLATVELLVGEIMSSAKRGGIKKGSVTAESAVSVANDTRKLEPEVVRMLVGLVVATGVIGALVLLS